MKFQKDMKHTQKTKNHLFIINRRIDWLNKQIQLKPTDHYQKAERAALIWAQELLEDLFIE